MKKIVFLLIAVLLCVSCQQPSENVPPVKTGIVLKTGTRYCVEKGASEMAPAILVQYSDGSSVEAVGKVEGSWSGFADITYENFKIENGAYIYDEALSGLPSTLDAEYNSKYVLLKAVEGGYHFVKDVNSTIEIKAENLYIVGEDGAEIKIDLLNPTNVINVTEGSVTIDGIKFSVIDQGKNDDNEVNIINTKGGNAFVKNCNFTGFNVISFINPDSEDRTAGVGINSNFDDAGGFISLTDNTFKDMIIVSWTTQKDIIQNNRFENSYIFVGSGNCTIEDNVFNNDSLGYGVVNYDGVLDEETIAQIIKDNKDCKVVLFEE